MNADRLLAHYEKIANAPDAIPRLRRFILNLAVHGKLVEQNPKDEPASGLLKKIAAEKKRLVKAGEIKKPKPLEPIEQPPFQTPANWMWCRLGELAELVRGVSFPATDKSDQPSVGLLPCFRSGNIQSKTVWGNFIFVPYKVLGGKHQFVKRGDILISIANSYALVGKCSIVDEVKEEATFGAFLAAIRLHEVLPTYATKFLSSDYSAKAFRVGSAQTTNIANITFATIRNHCFPLPPLAEQHRIVAKVDELMALCDRLETARTARETTRDRLAAASLAGLNAPDPDPAVFQNHAAFALDNLTPLTTRPDQIKALRQTILNLAVRGKLVDQDPNDEPASELLKRIAADRIRLGKSGLIKKSKPLPKVDSSDAPFDIPAGWTWARFPEVGLFGRGKSKHRPRNDPILYADGKYPFIQTGDVARSGGSIETYSNLYNDLGLSQSSMWPAGTLCITIAANIADSGILSFDACFPDSVVGLIAHDSFEDARFFDYFIRTAKANLQEFAPSTAQKNINLGILVELLIPLPPLAEQRRIVAKVDNLMALCNQLEASLAAGDDTRRRLLDALLHEALAPSEESRYATAFAR